MASASSFAHVRRWALVLGLVAGLVLQATPALADTVTLTVNRTSDRFGTITDDQGMLNCQNADPCSASYEQYCETDPETHLTLCDPVQVELTATQLPGFTAEWTGCASSSATTCSVSVGSPNGNISGKTVSIHYTDVQDPTLTLFAPSEGAVRTTSIGTWALPNDNDQVAGVRFTWTPPGHAPIPYDDIAAPYTPGLSTAGYPDGTYIVTAQSYDRAGRVSSVVTRNVIVDRVAPELAVTGPGSETAPGPWLRGGVTRSWTFAATDDRSGVASLTCAEDDVAVTCSGGAAGHSLQPTAGPHTVAFTAKDAGNNATTETRYFQVDATAPTVSLASPKHGAHIKDTTPTFAPVAADTESGVEAVTCQIGSGAVESCDEFTPTLTEGTHTLKLRATNGAGMARQITRSFTVDTTPPATSITSGPSRPFATAPAAAFTLGTNEPGAKFHCRIDGSAFTACASPRGYSDLQAGTHVFSARAKDVAGNTDRSPASWTWTVPLDDQNLTSGSAWTDLARSRYFRGTALRSSRQGATLVRNSVRARRLALVATTCSGCGTVDVYHGTTRIKRVSLDSDTTRHRQVFSLKAYTSLSAAAQVRVVVQSSGKPVTIDGLGIATR